MEEAFRTRQLDAIRVLDFDIRTKTLRETVKRFVEAAFPDRNDEEREEIFERTFAQKREITSIWSSMKLKNVVLFYGTLIILQLLALIFFQQ